MKDYALLALSVILATMGGVFYKIFNRKNGASFSDMQMYNALRYAVPIIIIFFVTIGNLSFPSGLTMTFGVFFGLASFLASMLYTYAISVGPLSLGTMFLTCSMFVPVLFSLLFLGGYINTFQIAGMSVLLAALILSAIEPKKRRLKKERNKEKYAEAKQKGQDKKNKRSALKWFWPAIGCMFINGAGNVLLTVHQDAVQGADNEFLLVAYICMAMLFGGVCLISRFALQTPFKFFGKTGAALSSVSGGMEYASMKLLVSLLAVIAPTVIFPTFFGGVVLLSALVAVTVFHERLAPVKWIGLGLGVVSLILLQISQ